MTGDELRLLGLWVNAIGAVVLFVMVVMFYLDLRRQARKMRGDDDDGDR